MNARHLLAIALLPLLALAGCTEEAAAPMPPRPVLTMTVEPQTTEMFGPFASTVEARYQTQQGFQVSGRMVARDVYVGDLVHKGRRLAAIDPTVTQFSLNRAKADVADAKAQLLNAQGIEQRQRTLEKGGNATQATLDNAVAGLATAKARLDQTQAALRTAEDQMGYTELHANFDGVITAWSAEVGQYVTNGQGVVTVARPDVREAVVDIADDLMINVKPGMVFSAHLLVAPNIATTAVVREINPLADAATRSHRVRLTLEDHSQAFRIGATIVVAVERAIAPRIVVPRTAILDEDKTQYVWLLNGDGTRVTRRKVQTGASDSEKVRIESGLAAGDRIVIVGVHSLDEGQRVDAGAAVTKAKGTRL